MAFIDVHREDLGIEPICRELAIAPSSCHEHSARRADPGKRPARAQRDDEIREQIKRVHDTSFGLYGARKVWHQMRREGIMVAKCTVERLMRAMGLAGVRRGKKTVTTVSKGRFICAGCALPLFASATKFDSGTGWPSFYDHLPHAIGTRADRSLGGARTEVHCARCAGHLGHVFEDGPRPTRLRYCMNSVAMRFERA